MKSLVLTAMGLAMASQVAVAAVSQAGREAQAAAGEYRAAVMACDMGWAFDFMYPPIKRTLADRFASRNPGQERQDARRIMGLEKETAEQAEERMKKNMAALRMQYVRMGQQMKAQGFKVERFVVGAPYAEYELVSSGSAARSVRAGSVQGRDGKIKRAEDIQWEGDRSRLVVLPTTLWISVTDAKTGRSVRMERKDFIYAVRDEYHSNSKATNRGTKLNKWYFIDSNTDVNTLRTYFPTLPLNINIPDTGDRPLN